MIAAVPAGVRVGITGLGASVPEATIGNEEVAGRLEVSEDWILDRSGIRTRHVAGPEETASSLAVTAASRAILDSGARAEHLDFVLVATTTPDLATPATAALVAAEIGAVGAAAYDFSAACTGFVYGLAQAYALVASGLAERGSSSALRYFRASPTGAIGARRSCSETEEARPWSNAYAKAASSASSSVATARGPRARPRAVGRRPRSR